MFWQSILRQRLVLLKGEGTRCAGAELLSCAWVCNTHLLSITRTILLNSLCIQSTLSSTHCLSM